MDNEPVHHNGYRARPLACHRSLDRASRRRQPLWRGVRHTRLRIGESELRFALGPGPDLGGGDESGGGQGLKRVQQDASGKKILHKVAKGDCASTIAAKYSVKISDLNKWNGWKKDTVLQPGQQVIVYVQ